MSELGIPSLLLIALGLSPDCFAVALSGSTTVKSPSRIPMLRLALAFGLFQAGMPVIGWLVGRTVVDMVAAYDHWVAFALLAFIGGRMLRESFRDEAERKRTDITTGAMLLGLAIATSIDALAIGLVFAFTKVNLLLACPIIGIVAFTMTIVGYMLGRKASSYLGKYAELAGGVILIAIGIRILISHLF